MQTEVKFVLDECMNTLYLYINLHELSLVIFLSLHIIFLYRATYKYKSTNQLCNLRIVLKLVTVVIGLTYYFSKILQNRPDNVASLIDSAP